MTRLRQGEGAQRGLERWLNYSLYKRGASLFATGFPESPCL